MILGEELESRRGCFLQLWTTSTEGLGILGTRGVEVSLLRAPVISSIVALVWLFLSFFLSLSTHLPIYLDTNRLAVAEVQVSPGADLVVLVRHPA